MKEPLFTCFPQLPLTGAQRRQLYEMARSMAKSNCRTDSIPRGMKPRLRPLNP